MFRDLERAYADSHLARLAGNTRRASRPASLHLDLISDLKRINSHICSIAYPILEEAGVLARTRRMPPIRSRRARPGGTAPQDLGNRAIRDTRRPDVPDLADICILFARKGGARTTASR